MVTIKYYILILLLSAILFPQQKFRTGVYTNLSPTMENSRQNFKQIIEMGGNTVINQTSSISRDTLEQFFDSVIIFNAYSETDYINHYSSGYYTKWEAEENVDVNASTPGVKHEFGKRYGTSWQSGMNNENIGKYLVTGPDYRQDKTYCQWYNADTIVYKVKFNMKIDGLGSPGIPVCEISVGYKAAKDIYTPIVKRLLYANELTNDFSDYILEYKTQKIIIGNPEQTQFNVKWLGNRNISVNYIEVYDKYIWSDYAEKLGSDSVCKRILNYAKTRGCKTAQYWYGLDEPHSIDNYAPYTIINSFLVDSGGYPPLVTAFYPNWDGQRNNEWTIKRFIETVDPAKFMYYYYPYYYDQPNDPYPDDKCLLQQHQLMQQPFDAAKKFPSLGDYYFVVQAFGFEPQTQNPFFQWRKPNEVQLRATVMLALAHGAKGIYFWPYYSYAYFDKSQKQALLVNAIVDTNNTPTVLYHEIKNNIFPRLNGKLGNELVGTNYKGDFIHRNEKNGQDSSLSFLTIHKFDKEYNWHAGILDHKLDIDKKYFLLINLNTKSTKHVKFSIVNKSGYNNLRILDIENASIDTSISKWCTAFGDIRAGDARLYMLTPVVKYGGKLIKDEKIVSPTTLNGDMEILNGAALHLYTEYTAKGNIIVRKGGKIIKHNGAALKFDKGKKLIAR